jgi:hypothetical protein
MPRRKPSWASGIERRAIKPGAVVPDFMRPDARGRCVRLQSHVEGTHRVKSIMKLLNFPKVISLSPTSLPQTSFTSQVLNSPPRFIAGGRSAFITAPSESTMLWRLFGGRHGDPTVSLLSYTLALARRATQSLSLRSIHSPWWRCPRSVPEMMALRPCLRIRVVSLRAIRGLC